MGTRRADAFFYGLFMDPDLLRSKGLDPRAIAAGWVEGFRLRIRSRAVLEQAPSSRVYGVVMSLSLAELRLLYGTAEFGAYVPEAVLVNLQSGGVVSALCYINAFDVGPFNVDYARSLVTAATKVGLPNEFIRSIEDSLASAD